MIDEEGLLHDIDGAVRNELLEVVGESLPAEVEPLDGVVEGEILQHGGCVGEGEAAVDDKAAVRGAAAGLVEVDERGRVSAEERAEPKVLEDELVGGALDGRNGEEGFDQQEGRSGGVRPQQPAEHSIPHFPFNLRVYQVSAVHRPPHR